MISCICFSLSFSSSHSLLIYVNLILILFVVTFSIYFLFPIFFLFASFFSSIFFFFYIFTSLSYSIVRVRLIEFALVLRSCCFALLIRVCVCECWCVLLLLLPFLPEKSARETRTDRALRPLEWVSECEQRTWGDKRANAAAVAASAAARVCTQKICTKFTNFMLISAKIGSEITTTTKAKRKKALASNARAFFLFSLNLSDVLEWKLSCSLCFRFCFC